MMNLSKQFKNYESDFSTFINRLKQTCPDTESQQQKGRALLWDKNPLSLDERTRLNQSCVPQRPYPYQTKN